MRFLVCHHPSTAHCSLYCTFVLVRRHLATSYLLEHLATVPGKPHVYWVIFMIPNSKFHLDKDYLLYKL